MLLPQPKSRPHAFTLIELLVVVAIIVILTAVTLPAVKALTQGNNQKQAVNLLTSLLNNARALAISSHTPAGVVIYEDPSATSQTAAQIVLCSSTAFGSGSPPVLSFVRAPLTAAQLMPLNIKVGTFANSSSIFYLGEANNNLRIILFDADGQMILRNGLVKDASVTDAAATAWKFSATATSNNCAPGFIVYDGSKLQADASRGTVVIATPASVSTWVQNNADIVILNPYTGNVIR